MASPPSPCPSPSGGKEGGLKCCLPQVSKDERVVVVVGKEGIGPGGELCIPHYLWSWQEEAGPVSISGMPAL